MCKQAVPTGGFRKRRSGGPCPPSPRPKCTWPILITVDTMKCATGRDVIKKVIVAAALETFIKTECEFRRVIKIL